MEWVIILSIVATYCGLSEQIKKLSKTQASVKKDFPSLKYLLNKNIEIEIIDDCLKSRTTGILVKYDDMWIALENKDKKGITKQNYFRISNIASINILDK